MKSKTWKGKLFHHRYLFGLIGLAFILRVFNLSDAPPSLYWEEVALGYDAYSIAQTGRDHHGHFLPVVAFESFGDWKPSGYFYALVPFVKILGLNAWAVRLPSVIAGTLMVLMTYLIARELKFSERIALISTAMLAIMPWHIHFSRAGFEVNLATTLMGAGVWALLVGRRKKVYIPLAAVLMVFSMYTYHGLRILAPLLTLLIGFLYFGEFRKRFTWVGGSLILALFLGLPLVIALQTPAIQQRFAETSWFSVSSAVEKTNQWRAEDGNTLVSRLVHHRYWYWAKEISANALKHFDLDFLFIAGDENPRHQSGFFALLYPWIIVPLIWGIYRFLGKPRKEYLLLIGWILLATIPPALTKTTPHTLRFLPASPAFALIIGSGMVAMWTCFERVRFEKLYKLVTVSVVVVSLLVYAYDYHMTYPKRAATAWQDGYEELMKTLQPYWEEGQAMTITRDYGRPVMYALFYWQVDPVEVQQYAAGAAKDQGELLELGPVRFDTPQAETDGIIVTTVPIAERELLREIYSLDGKPVFYVYE